jgi:hypothetical protein
MNNLILKKRVTMFSMDTHKCYYIKFQPPNRSPWCYFALLLRDTYAIDSPAKRLETVVQSKWNGLSWNVWQR